MRSGKRGAVFTLNSRLEEKFSAILEKTYQGEFSVPLFINFFF
jgi:hypothetical protein